MDDFNTKKLTAYFGGELEIAIDTATGETYLTEVGYCFLSKLSAKGLAERQKSLTPGETILADIDTGYRMISTVLFPANLAYRMMLLDNELLGIKMGEIGANQYIQELAGYFPHTSYKVDLRPTPITPRSFKTLGNSLEDTIAILNSLRDFYTTMPRELVEQFLLDQLQKYHPELSDFITDSQTFFGDRIASEYN